MDEPVSYQVMCKNEKQRKELRILVQKARKKGERIADCLIRILKGDE